MILALDVGNSQIYAGLCDGEKILVNFRKNSKTGYSSDEIGIFLRGVIRENGYDPTSIRQIVMCSVVPDLVHSLRSACKKYFGMYPFILQAGVKTGLKIKYKNPLEVGADRIANAIGATALFPDQNIIIVDMGTATTFCAVKANKEYLGGTIVAGLRLCMEALESKTAKLPAVEIVKTEFALGKNTVESIQSGLYFSHIGMVKEICQRLTEECFAGERPIVVGTGGFSSLFEKEKLFNHIIPDLVITGLLTAHKMNL